MQVLFGIVFATLFSVLDMSTNPKTRRSNRLASMQQGLSSLSTSLAEEHLLDKPPPAPLQQQVDVNLSQASSNKVHDEPSFLESIY